MNLSDVNVGDVVAERTVHLDRSDLVRYAGASGDFNPIHYRDDIAREMELPGVLAHGMLTMALAATDAWAGDPGRIVGYSTRFTKPVVVDAEHGADLAISATVGEVSGDIIRIDIAASCDGQGVLGRAQLRVRAE